MKGLRWGLYLLCVGLLIGATAWILMPSGTRADAVDDIFVGVVAGCLVALALYCFTLYLFRPGETALPLLGAFCLCVLLRLLFVPDSIGLALFPGVTPNLAWRLRSLGAAGSAFFHAQFVTELFGGGVPGRLLRWNGAIILASCLLIVCMAPQDPAGTGSSVGSAVTGAVLLLLAAWVVARSGGMWANPVKLLYFVANLLYATSYIVALFYLPFFAVPVNIVYILSNMMVLADRYARAHNEVERVNANLETLVEERTGELHRTNRMLAASQTALREMIANISHDLKTPLTVLSNYLEILNDGQAEDGDEQAEYLEIAYHKNLDLQRLVGNLFEVTRMESSEVAYRREWMAAAALLDRAEEKYAALAHDRGLRFDTALTEDFQLCVDPDKIWSVLDNLVYNALRHTERGFIALTAQRFGQRGVLQVQDTGEGVAPEHLPHIFERFYRASRARAVKDGSSGIGLYIVKAATEGMGGTVKAESTLGAGAVFTLAFEAREMPE